MKNFILIIFSIYCSFEAMAQPYTSRIIVSDSNIPIPNVNVFINGTFQGVTGKNGIYIFERKDNRVFDLTLSHVEYSRVDTVIKDESPTIQIILHRNIVSIDSIEVSTGYQRLSKYQTTGSFETIGNERLERQVGINILPMLEGLTTGLSVDRRKGVLGGFQIRGFSSLSSDMINPLIIVDNFPYEGDIESINPHDVENVTLLKDAAASAIWGARAGNGVIVITTKKGKYDQPLNVTVTSNLTLTDKPDLFYLPRIESAAYIENEKFLFEKGVYNSVLNNTTTRPMVSPVVELLDRVRKGTISESEANSKIEDLKKYDIRNDYNKYLYRRGINQQYFLSLNGGNSKFNYLLSTGMDKNLQTSKGNSFERVTVRSMNSFKPVEKLNVQLDLNLAHSKATINNPGETPNIYPYARLADEDGNGLPIDQNYRYSYIDTVARGALMDWRYYPINEIAQRDNWKNSAHLRTNVNINYTMTPWMNVDLKYQFDREFGENHNYQSEDLYFTRNLINRYTNISNRTVTNRIPKGGILDQGNTGAIGHNLRGQLNIDQTWQGNHNITAIFGGEIRKINTEDSFYRTYGYNERLRTSSSVDYVTRFPIFNRLGGNLSIPYVDRFGSSDNRMVSLFTNAAYSYLQRYTISLSARRDASNLFGVRTNNKWKPLWSAGMKWALDKEEFVKSPWLDLLVLRASYGHSGNVNNSIPAVVTMSYDNSLSYFARLPYGFLENAPNADLRWEDVSQFNVGVDGSIFSNRFTFTLEYYKKNATDLITDEDADPTLGMSSFKRNSGNLLTQGVDFTFGMKLIDRRFKWSANLIASWNQNELLKIHREVLYLTAGEYYIPPSEGYPINSLFSYRFIGLNPETGNPIGIAQGEQSEDYPSLTNSSMISLEDMVHQGTVMPSHFGNLMNTFAWKNFSLSVNLSGKFGYKYRRNTILYSSFAGTNFTQIHGDYHNRWQKPGDEKFTTIPSFTYPANSSRDNFYRFSEATVEDASHIRIHDISLSYSPHFAWKGIKRLNFRLYCNNVNIILWKKSSSHLDPLYGNNSPIARTYSLGLNLQF
ncbi:SusC/RagA family TonB-linked outer membrane protein [Sphingobacterium lactis]|uniref:SusC/RagA family TonB-linked outer membrane protein n=1 Tax=Sphingobacterium lactis TaxID=797291 RepID=UPI003EC79E82